jgi:hypothetical protein
MRSALQSHILLRAGTGERLKSTIRRSEMLSVDSLSIDDDLLLDSVLYGHDLSKTLHRQNKYKARPERGPYESS